MTHISRKILTGLLLIAAGCAKKQEPTVATAGEESAVKQALQDWSRAYITRDFQTLDRVRADDWTYAGDPSGMVVTKQIADEAFRTDRETKYLAVDHDNLQVRFYGDTAVVTGRETMAWEAAGKQDRGVYRLTAVFVKQAGQWRCVASHSSPVQPSTKP